MRTLREPSQPTIGHRLLTLSAFPAAFLLLCTVVFPETACADVNYPPLACPAEHVLVTYDSGSIRTKVFNEAQTIAYDRCAAKIPQSSFLNHWKNAQAFVAKDVTTGSFTFVCMGCAPYIKYNTADGLEHVAVRTASLAFLQNDFGRWSAWLNRDSPGGKGDYETLNAFKKEGKLPCPKPTAIECSTVKGKSHSETGDKVTCNLDVGAVCINDQQEPGRQCQNYRIRVLCGQ